MRVHPPRPWVADAGAAPGVALRYPGVLEFIDGQVFRLALDRDKPSGAETARHGQIAGDVSGVVPGVEFFLDGGRDVDPPHLQEGRHLDGLLDRVGVHREDLPVRLRRKLRPIRLVPILVRCGEG